ncbi:polymer-forming cytoskeletal family protein [Marinomonas sp. M1K-6]|uniref:Polymer-forming cytoskeletal family protein n=1 Tax=Marinomonas profundi TaxID=2726122 RepID=A0A847R5T7_9GAMM|nr:polymer-forming cytoskeletal protein [Marinomonas profundi]NLQ16234.1 polymer-forming cytoskeletal family protein [Marinomonas profundi]UDV03189.1 polymer-forming cytoskeletal protein [Marinomonas profundi]
MGIFSGQNRNKSQSTTTTLIAAGCSINGHLKVENYLQIDGHVEGQIEVANQLKISESGNVLGEIITERLIVNGSFEGTCHANHVDILSNGRVSGIVYSDNLSIEPGGKFTGVTHPSEKMASKPEIKAPEIKAPEIKTKETQHLDKKVALISNDPPLT